MQVLSCQRVFPLVEVCEAASNSTSGHASRAGSSWDSSFTQVTPRRHVSGFTLVELMIALAISLVLIMIAVPSFQRITVSNKLTTTANDVVGAINIARMEAIKLNTSAQLCGSASSGSDALGTACGTQAGAVYALINGVATQILAGSTGIVAPLAGTVTAVRFSGQGLARTPGSSTLFDGAVADISTSAISGDNHRCIKMVTGSIVTTTTASGPCK